MRVLIRQDAAAVARDGARVVAEAASAKPDLVLALPTGRTAVPFYDELAAGWHDGRVDLSLVRAFNVDELILPADDPRNFRSFMQRHAWRRTGLDPKRCDIPDGAAADLEAECGRYDAALMRAGPLDVAVLGLGADGHVAYNLPGDVAEGTHVVRVPDVVAASLGVPDGERPLRAITVGLGVLRSARTVLVMAAGAAKAEAVRRLRLAQPDPLWPCSLLYDHPRLELVIDKSAAGCA